MIATQTYESFVAKLKNEHVAAQLIANLRTKIWLCAEDNYTARQAADLDHHVQYGHVLTEGDGLRLRRLTDHAPPGY
ncbi:MAG: hypothetical protein HC774_02840 [Sphingomonadales bacterium]|nr:hypothetical protein [Sphingomonadales bacterium]